MSLSGDGKALEATSGSMVGRTVETLTTVALVETVTNTFGLYLLHAQGRKSWFVSTLTTIAVVISLAAWILTYTPLRNLNPVPNLSPESLESCRGLTTPEIVAHCGNLHDTDGRSLNLHGSIMVSCLMVLSGDLAVQGYATFPWCSHWLHALVRPQRPFPPLEGTVVQRGLQILRRCLIQTIAYGCRWRHVFVRLAFAAILVWTLLWQVAQNAPDGGGAWTFGQLIAVTTWAPNNIGTVDSMLCELLSNLLSPCFY